MEHSTMHKLVKVASLSLLVLTTTSGLAGLELMVANPASSQPDSSGGGSAPGPGLDQADPPPAPPTPSTVPLPVP